MKNVISFIKTHRIWFIMGGFVLFLYMSCFHWTGVHEIGIRRNMFTGEISLDSVAGPELSWPWVQVSLIDVRPQRLCIECGCKTINCRLVSFNPEGWREFTVREGFRYWWWANRFSFNTGAEREYRGMDWIMRGYGFDSADLPFVTVKKAL